MSAESTLTLEQFATLRDLVFRALGLYFEDTKVYFLSKRVEQRMRLLKLDTFGEYLFLLRFSDTGGAEMGRLATLITTNETYMFREYDQLATFSDFCLPELLARKEKSGRRKLRIWSAGCSSGDEAYTLAIILREVLSDLTRWDPQITATDIDENMLEHARRGLYDERSVRLVPQAYSGAHLLAGTDGYRITPETKKLVEVRYLNLHDRSAMAQMRDFDVIFCRNVLIYFNDESRRAAVDGFFASLNPGGYLFLGHSESVGRISPAFRLVRSGDYLAYQKP